MTLRTLTPETAAAERERLLTDVRQHRRAASRALRALERLEDDCRRHGIRLIREPIRPVMGETDARTDPDAR